MTEPNEPTRLTGQRPTLPSMEELESRLIEMRKQHGEGSPEAAMALRDMAKNAHRLGPDFYTEANKLYHGLIVVQIFAFGEQSAEVAETYHSLSGLDKSQNNYAQSAHNLQKSLDIYCQLKESGSAPDEVTEDFMRTWRRALASYYRMSNQPELAAKADAELDKRSSLS